ncbi:MAG: hypothetical protein JWR23_2077 [Mucilaginibacter sp.]|nr:hypothetical protein [Mucilaginibacter sp.]
MVKFINLYVIKAGKLNYTLKNQSILVKTDLYLRNMKRNLLKGIVFISAVVLSSCSVSNKLANSPTTGDDVYFTKAIAGDNIEYADANNYQSKQNNYKADDDYYYYGDYASRISRFSYFTPFDYDDDFYYGYTPYNTYNNYNISANTNYNNSYSPFQPSPYDFGVYSPFDYGYNNFGGYDDFSYGSIYTNYLYTGGGRHHGRQYSRSTSAGGGSGLTFRKANSGSGNPSNGIAGSNRRGYANNGTNTIYPGRPNNTSVARTGTTNNNTRAVRTDRQDVRPASQQVVERASQPSPAPANTSSSSSSSSGSSGGGGRPVRP